MSNYIFGVIGGYGKLNVFLPVHFESQFSLKNPNWRLKSKIERYNRLRFIFKCINISLSPVVNVKYYKKVLAVLIMFFIRRRIIYMPLNILLNTT